MSYPSVVLAKSPAAYYRCQEASGLLQDSSGNARHCTAERSGGTVDYEIASPIATDPSDFSIDILDHWFSSPDGAWFDMGDTFTLELWFRRDGGVGNTHVFLSKGSGSYMFYLDASSVLRLDRQGITNVIASTITITDLTTWHHCVCTKSGETTRLYVDGNNVTGAGTNDTIANTTVAVFIGARDDGTFMPSAFIDEIAIYPTALSHASVQENYNASLLPAGVRRMDLSQFPKAKLRPAVPMRY